MLNTFKEFQAEEANPTPSATINSYRSFGYNLQTAVADIIDNSISAGAKNVWIEYDWLGKDSTVIISDDGRGMDLKELVQAMTPGSKDPNHPREENDLGRFGLGLKTASFSQSKRLTVITKQQDQSVCKRCWDLDYVNEVQKWALLDYCSDPKLPQQLQGRKSGTTVFWERVDRLAGNSAVDNQSARRVFMQEFDTLEIHIGMVFHRYIESKKIKIHLNDNVVHPWNPFLVTEGSTLLGPEFLSPGNVEVKIFILPHLSKLSPNIRDSGGGPSGWYDQQGFYIYRNQRLIVAGDWLGLFPKNDHSKLARISIDFPNELDHLWDLDIKKSSARPPGNIKRDLVRLGNVARKESARIYNFRGEALSRNPDLPEFDFQSVWISQQLRDGSVSYGINRQHPLLKLATAETVSARTAIETTLSIIEKNLPVETILYYHNENPANNELRNVDMELDPSVITLGKLMFASLRSQGFSTDVALKQILNIEPFNQYPQLIETLQNE